MVTVRRPLSTLLLIILVVAGIGAAVWRLVPSPWFGEEPPPTGEIEYRPVEVDQGVRHRLVVWDYPWPHKDPLQDPDRFRGEQPALWRDRLARAASVFQKAYPNVQVVVEEIPFYHDWRDEQSLPDVVALWWDGPALSPRQLVPVTPYLTEEARAQYHPLAWLLQERDGELAGWPRWIAAHYWLAPLPGQDGDGDDPGAWDWVIKNGWTLPEALDHVGDGPLLAPLGSAGIWLELLSSVSTGEYNPAGLWAGHLGTLERWLATGEKVSGDLGGALIEGRFKLAGGLGPAFTYWAVVPPRTGDAATGPGALTLLPPPVVEGDPVRGPAFSLGAYGVIRKHGPDELQRAQVAMALAEHLSRWEQESAVERLLAFPAYRPGIGRWHVSGSLPEKLRQRLLDDAAHAISGPLRVYGYDAGLTRQWDAFEVRRVYREWMKGSLSSQQAAQQVWGSQEGINPEG